MPYIISIDTVAPRTMEAQDNLASLDPASDMSQPITPTPAHATLPADVGSAISDTSANLTPPPSSQVPRSTRGKSRTPTPTFSHISTPPPTVEVVALQSGALGDFAGTMSEGEMARATKEELRTRLAQVQTTLSAAKMSAAHYKLQYQMLSQESAAAIERMAVEARMAQFENDVICNAEQAKAAATPTQVSPAMPEGTIPVQKDLYQHMCRELQQLTHLTQQLEAERSVQDRIIASQEIEIASLGDKVTLMRERIRESREHINRYRQLNESLEHTPRSSYATPHRHARNDSSQQPFAALLQASEMASQAANRAGRAKKGHVRNTHSMSSMPQTPQRTSKHQPTFYTPAPRRVEVKVPSTAPLPRTSAMRTPEGSQRHPLSRPTGPPSDGTVSAAEVDSEAETDIIEEDEVDESQASRAASHMLRTSQEQQVSGRERLTGRGMLSSQPMPTKQTTLFGAVRKRHIDRGDDEPASKRGKTGPTIGLGIEGLRH